jgi:hypothetical protein
MSIKNIKIECPGCKGTGVYQGCAERDGAAVQCQKCDGNGWVMYEYNEFESKKQKNGVSWVVERNPGICISPQIVIGGMSYSDWLEGKKFEKGTEMREYTCPYWWYYQKYKLSRCDLGLKHTGVYSKCQFFCDKKACWKEFDEISRSLP